MSKLQKYIVTEYINNNKDLYVPFAHFYNNFQSYKTGNTSYTKYSISRTLKVLGINTVTKKMENKFQSCFYISKEELHELFLDSNETNRN